MKKLSFETLKDLVKRDEGLTEAEVSTQRTRYGANEIVEVAGHPWLDLALDTLRDPMIWFLFGIGTVFILVGDTNEAIILFIAIFPLVFMDAILHWRTQASTSGLKGQLASKVKAVRGGQQVEIDSRELVPGDIVVVTPDLYLPADGVFQKVADLQIDESLLTGESLSIQKLAMQADPFSLVDKGPVTVDPFTLGYAGTRALTGSGQLRVLLTGKLTAYGDIVQSVAHITHDRTPLQKSIGRLVQGLIIATAVLCSLLAGVRIYQGHPWLDALLSAATLAIAAIPEEFPVVFTFFLGVGVYRLAQRNALVRRAVSVENIGRVTHICTDKTGTVTVGLLRLAHVVPAGAFAEIDVLKTAFAASTQDGSDPVDIAIRDAAVQHRFSVPSYLHIFPFTEDRKQQTVFVNEADGRVVAYLKGAPETVIGKSTLGEQDRILWQSTTEQWAREGHKVLACARKVLSGEEASQGTEPSFDFELCGLLAFEDPPRPEVADAIRYCQQNNIRVLMITGDHQDTAVAIAKDIGLGGVSPVVVSAEDHPEKFQQDWLDSNPVFLRELHGVARCTPLQKLAIVNALKKSGELVAVTGDGVNDVPALKAADIGIAMGERGTRSAKEVASIVLADDNFRTIVGAIMEGRQLFTNLRTGFKYLLLVHIPFVLTAAIIPLLGYPLIYLPVHVVWLELVIHPSALFAFQQPATATQKSYQKVFFGKTDMLLVLTAGVAMTAVLGFSFIWGLAEHSNVGLARAIVLAMLTLWSAGLVVGYTRMKTKASVAVVVGTVVSTVALIQTPQLASIIHLAPLQFRDWAVTVVVISALLSTLALKKA